MNGKDLLALTEESERLLDCAIAQAAAAGVLDPSFMGEPLRARGWHVQLRLGPSGRLGVCRLRIRRIDIWISPAAPLATMTEVLRHEFAHAVQATFFPGSPAHGEVFKACAQALGARPIASLPATEQLLYGTARWALRIMGTGEIVRRYLRRPRVANWADRFVPGRKAETLGRLELSIA